MQNWTKQNLCPQAYIRNKEKLLTNPPVRDDSDKVLRGEGLKHRNKELHHMLILGKFTTMQKNIMTSTVSQTWNITCIHLTLPQQDFHTLSNFGIVMQTLDKGECLKVSLK